MNICKKGSNSHHDCFIIYIIPVENDQITFYFMQEVPESYMETCQNLNRVAKGYIELPSAIRHYKYVIY